MLLYLMKLVPLFLYPLGLGCVLIVAGLLLRRRRKAAAGVLAAALVVLWLGGNGWVSNGLMKTLEWRHLPPEELTQVGAIVVLGRGVRPLEYPRSTVELDESGDRLLHAAWLYREGVADHILVTDGAIDWMFSPDQHITPAENMAAALVLMGVPDEVIWREDQARNTRENAIYSREFLQEKDIGRIALVTSASHMPRALKLFEGQGFDVVPSPTDFQVTELGWKSLRYPNARFQLMNLLPTAQNLEMTSAALKEYLGLTAYRLIGWM
jgi:uncharacterized SAM-binding protein YcdF (DUF218 family)